MRDRPAPRHDEGFQLVVQLPGQLQHAGRALDQFVEALESGIVQRRPVCRLVEGEDDLKLEAEVERDFRRNLVRPVGKRRYEQQPRRRLGKESTLARAKLKRPRLQLLQRGSDPLDDRLDRLFLQRLDPVTGNADAKDERKPRRIGALRRSLDLVVKLARLSVQSLISPRPTFRADMKRPRPKPMRSRTIADTSVTVASSAVPK